MNGLFRNLTAVCVALFFVVQTAFCAAAENADFTAAAEECFGYFSEQSGGESFPDGREYGGADWAVYCYSRLYGAAWARDYAHSAEQKVREMAEYGGFVKPTDYHKAAVCIAVAGGDFRQAAEVGVFFNEQLDRQGFNAYIWALIALNVTGAEQPENAVNTAHTLSEYIISRQHEDGSFSLIGDSGDVDITAAAVYALAGSGIPAAERSAQLGADWLCGIEGGYSSMGVRNCESTAQAVIALCAAGRSEQARIAAGQLEEYRRESGYAHLPEGEVNGLATVQALEAFTALAIMERGEALFGRAGELPTQTAEYQQTEQADVLVQTDNAVEMVGNPVRSGLTGTHIKAMISAALGAVVCIILFIVRKKKALPAAVCLAVLCGGVWLLDIKTPEEYYAQSGGGSMRAVVSADCGAILGRAGDAAPGVILPEGGKVIPRSEVMLPEGATAFDALIAVARERRVTVDYTGSGFGVYVKGIGGLYEFSFGEMSGWMYRVNGEFPEMSASEYTLHEGDVVEFLYTTDLGRDIGNIYSDENG